MVITPKTLGKKLWWQHISAFPGAAEEVEQPPVEKMFSEFFHRLSIFQVLNRLTDRKQ